MSESVTINSNKFSNIRKMYLCPGVERLLKLLFLITPYYKDINVVPPN